MKKRSLDAIAGDIHAQERGSIFDIGALLIEAREQCEYGQWMAWKQLAASGFYVSTTPSSSFVYLLTGAHAVHLMGGVVALLVAGLFALLHRSATTRSIVLDVAGWYWHFMAALWIYILLLLEFAK